MAVAVRARDAPQARFGWPGLGAAAGSVVATVSFWDRQVEELMAGIAALLRLTVNGWMTSQDRLGGFRK